MKQKKIKLSFPLRIFCSNCFTSNIIRFPRGMVIEEVCGYGKDDTLQVKGVCVKCPKCDSVKVNKIREALK
jgi:hypothetical protein